jgi:flagellar hook protein FlgE
MSINSALLAGVSGLVANSSALAAISDNISNVNTTAYKRSQVDFSTLVTSQAVKGEYSAGGVQGVTKSFVSQQGLIQAAASSTDLAISGDGFFVVSPSATTPGSQYTRAGAFQPDANGYLVNNAGLYLQGWPVQANGTFNTDPSDLSLLGPINVKNLGAAVQPTTNIGVSANVDQTTPIPTSSTYNAGTASMAMYAAGVAGGTAPDAPPIEFNVVDSMGGTHKLALALCRTVNPNSWNAEIYAVPATDVTATNGQIKSGLINFNTDGTINLNTSTLFGPATTPPAAPSPQVINLGASSATAPTPPAVNWATGLGINSTSLTMDLSQLTQIASASTVNSVTSNGAGAGNIVGIQVDSTGVVSALFDNSQVRKIAQVAIATFPNSDGLQRTNGNAYRATLDAGQMTLKTAGVGGAGKIASSSLEASTVDLSSEFTGLITTQKAYSASSKIITTADQMLDELINIIR